MQAYSLDLRQRILRAYEQGEGSISDVAQQFSVSPAFVNKLLRQWRQTGDLSPLPHGGGKPPSLSRRQLGLLKRQVRQQDDASLAELQQMLSEQEQVNVHLSTISRTLAKLGLPRKKSA
jgi:transposase